MGYYVEYKEEGTEAWVKVCLRLDYVHFSKTCSYTFFYTKISSFCSRPKTRKLEGLNLWSVD